MTEIFLCSFKALKLVSFSVNIIQIPGPTRHQVPSHYIMTIRIALVLPKQSLAIFEKTKPLTLKPKALLTHSRLTFSLEELEAIPG